ncbi:MAG: Gfo/Idh/MocA family oxidoreductase [Treponema sp.]|nr:Gfo/Idh/MocA family oxidoreductase [Treponema sp.]
MSELTPEIPLSQICEKNKIKTLPKATKSRLVLLLGMLENWKKDRVSSIEISTLLSCKDSLVRYDLSFLEVPAGAKNGYDVQSLKQGIRQALGSEGCIQKKCCVVGLGRLGAALLDDGIFEGSDFKICAGFDSSVNRVEMLRSTFELFPANRIESVCQQQKIQYAFLCCPNAEVEKMVQRLVNAGIKGIVNYTTAVFPVPPTVKVQNVSPITALMNM